MLGKHGTTIRKIRPVKRDFIKWCEPENSHAPVEAWIVLDWEDWKRDLFPVGVKSNTLTGSFASGTVKRTIKLDPLPIWYPATAYGLVLYVPFLGFILNPFDDPPFMGWMEDDEDYLTSDYTLDGSIYLDDEGPYIPNEDFCFGNLL